jgi:hypothetical protein
MNTEIIYTSKEIGIEARAAATGIKSIILKIGKALSFDAEAIFKSKDWPYLWPK